MRKILSTVFALALIAMIWVSCSKKEITGTIAPDKAGTSGTTLAAGQAAQNTTSATSGSTTSSSTSSSTTSSTGSTTHPGPSLANVSMTVNGTNYTLKDGDNVNFDFSLVQTEDQYGEEQAMYRDEFYDGKSLSMNIRIGAINFVKGYTGPDDFNFYDFFYPKKYDYTTDGVNGVSITFEDGPTEYSSYNFNQNQTASSFNILSVKDTTYKENGYAYGAVRVTAKFNCKLYDGGGHAITLSNGNASLLFVNR